MGHIVIADDDTASLDVLTVALEAEGHSISYAMNGQEAYEKVLEEKPDLVFLDVMMPVFNGFETCRMLREDPDVPKALPIIFLTAVEVDGVVLEKSGATACLPKRHMVTELRELLSRHLPPDAFPQPR